jgi:tetratricopeptide (TPR) repeat protein
MTHLPKHSFLFVRNIYKYALFNNLDFLIGFTYFINIRLLFPQRPIQGWLKACFNDLIIFLNNHPERSHCMKNKMGILFLAASVAVLLIAVCSNRSKLADVHFQRGRAFEKSSQPDSALAQYRLAIQVDPKHMKANMAYQDLAAGRFGMDDAVWDDYEALAKTHASDPAWQVLFTRLWDNNDGKIEQALRIVERHRRYFWGYVLLGSAYEGYSNRDYTPEAIEAYEKAARIDPSEIEMNVKLASLYRRVDDYANAKKALQKALASDSTRVDLLPLLWRNETLLAANKDSIKNVLNGKIDKNLARHGKNVSFLNSLMNLLGQMDQARQKDVAKQVVALDPKGQQAEEEAMNRVWDEKDPQKGIREAVRFLDSFPDSRHAQSAFGMWLTFSKMRPEFRDMQVDRFAKGLIEKNPGRTWVYESLFRYYANKAPDQTGKLEQISRSWLDASSGRKKAPIINTLAGLYLKHDRTDEALYLLLQADSLCQRYQNPFPDVYASLGDAYQEKGNTDLALENFSRAVGLGGGDAVIDRCVAAYEKKFGSREGARKFINQKILTQSAVKKPYPAPGFVLGTAADDTVRMTDFKGKVVLIAIWNPG